MTLRLYIDKDSGSHALCAALQARGIAVLRTEDAGNSLFDDAEQLAFADSQGMVVYTANVGDFARLHAQRVSIGRSHSGIIGRSKQQMSIGRQLDLLLRVHVHYEMSELRGQFIYLEDIGRETG